VLIAKKKRGIKINAIKDLDKYQKIGVILDDAGEQILLELKVKNKKIYRINSPELAVKMLQRDRIDMWAYGRIVALWYIKKYGYNPSDYEEVYTLKESYQNYVFHKDTDDKIITQFQEALDKLKANGTIEKISKKYLH